MKVRWLKPSIAAIGPSAFDFQPGSHYPDRLVVADISIASIPDPTPSPHGCQHRPSDPFSRGLGPAMRGVVCGWCAMASADQPLPAPRQGLEAVEHWQAHPTVAMEPETNARAPAHRRHGSVSNGAGGRASGSAPPALRVSLDSAHRANVLGARDRAGV